MIRANDCAAQNPMLSRYGDYSIFLLGLAHVYLSNQRHLYPRFLILVPTVEQARRCHCSPCILVPRSPHNKCTEPLLPAISSFAPCGSEATPSAQVRNRAALSFWGMSKVRWPMISNILSSTDSISEARDTVTYDDWNVKSPKEVSR